MARDTFSPRPLSRKDASGQIAAQLRAAIVSGIWSPGDRVPTEVDLAETFEVSRSTAREALKLLSAMGLVASMRGAAGGTYVVIPDAEAVAAQLSDAMRLWYRAGDVTVQNVDEARGVLEEFSVVMAARRRSEEDLEAIHDPVLASADDTIDMEAWLALDLQFHTAITRAARNPILELAMTSVHLIRPVTNQVFVHLLDRERVRHQHEQIYRAIAAQDPDQARAAFHAHIDYLDAVRAQALRALDAEDVRIADIAPPAEPEAPHRRQDPRATG
ncbi:FadR/GntR family transcriptional regulator [Kocuria oceani]|uniref:FadR/GntR family transcriptional regulator n=1 Tax=Kocuria oceani TaxID=988827 RepID=UPI004037470D